jgi:hypothetical protein
MAEETKAKRPWWKRKTELGVGLMLVGAVLSVFPVTAPASVIVIKVGELLTAAGVVHRNLKGESN